jgi:tetratricopeptide (TPR) repeat protein
MACRRQLDIAGRSAAIGALIRSLAVLLLLACAFLPAATADSSPETSSLARQLFEQQRWSEVIRLVEQAPAPSAELEYYYGIALAQLGRLEQARQALFKGQRLQPSDRRFAIELAGVEFKQKRYRESTKWLHRALKLDPGDAYANDFLGTVYFLEDNLEAALKYWNRAQKPEVESLRLDPEPRVHPVVLDRAFAFAPASKLQLADLLTSRTRIRGLEIFPTYSFDLNAREDGKFDLTFRAHERNGWGANKWMALLSLFRGVFYQTVYPEYFNVGGSATNVVSLLRWDYQKRRLMVSLSGPLRRDAKWRYRIGTDLRNENWDVRSLAVADSIRFAALNLRRQAVGAAITEFVSGKWSWSAGLEVSHRDFRDFALATAPTPGLFPNGIFSDGYQLKQLANVNYELWRLPERRLTIEASGRSELASIWSEPRHLFSKFSGGLMAHWYPRARGNDYEMQHRIRVGSTFGESPFDELFALGIERDNDLWLRAHPGTHDGRKGSAPMGRNYFLSSWELDKNVYRAAFFNLRLGPFLDTGKILDASPGLASNKWFWDTGAQAKVQVLGVEVIFVYGKDLRSGNNTFYATVGR